MCLPGTLAVLEGFVRQSQLVLELLALQLQRSHLLLQATHLLVLGKDVIELSTTRFKKYFKNFCKDGARCQANGQKACNDHALRVGSSLADQSTWRGAHNVYCIQVDVESGTRSMERLEML